MQVILGSGGAIGTPLATALAQYTDQVRLCSRSPHAMPQVAGTTYTHVPTDLLDAAAVLRAVEGTEVAYICPGLPYETKVWQRDWPLLIDNVIAACTKTGMRVAFFDNVYAYAKTAYAHMTEASPMEPPSQKGKVRKAVLDKLWAANNAGDIQLTVARAADFYGPGVKAGYVNLVIIDKLVAGSAAQWLGDPDAVHSFTYTPDAGRDFALLGNAGEAYGKSWHLPTAPNPWTGRQWTTRTAKLLGAKDKLSVLPQWLFWLIGRFNGQLGEIYEVRDQQLVPYVFDSSRFERAFGVEATSYEAGLAASVAYAQAQVKDSKARRRVVTAAA